MNLFKCLCIGMCALFFVGCDSVYSTKPMGEKSVSISAEDWEGKWMHDDGALIIEVIDSLKGVLRITEDLSEGDKSTYESIEASLLEYGEWVFASWPDKENPDKSQYLWGRLKKSDDQIIFWAPDLSKFKALVENGTLPGIEDSDENIILGELTREHMNLIVSSAKGVLLDWEEPLVLRR